MEICGPVIWLLLFMLCIRGNRSTRNNDFWSHAVFVVVTIQLKQNMTRSLKKLHILRAWKRSNHNFGSYKSYMKLGGAIVYMILKIFEVGRYDIKWNISKKNCLCFILLLGKSSQRISNFSLESVSNHSNKNKGHVSSEWPRS